MDKTIEVKIKFIGSIATSMGMKEITHTIFADFDNGIEDIRMLVQSTAGNVMFTILLNGCSIELNQKVLFDINDVFSVVPIVLGG